MTPTQVSLNLAAKSAESKFDPKRVQDAVSILADIHPDLDGKHLLFYSGDIRYARASVDTCDCPGFKAKRELVCPHRLACMIHAKAVKIEREMKTAYPKVIEQMVALMSDDFAREHKVGAGIIVHDHREEEPFSLYMYSYGDDQDIVRDVDNNRVNGNDLADMCREVFDKYRLIKDKHTRRTITETENQGYGQTQVDPAISAKARRELLLSLRTGQAIRDSGEIYPESTCPYCHGTGVVTDQIDYGSTVVSMPSACEYVVDNWDDLSREQKLLAWKDYLETVPRGDETYGRDPLDSSYGIPHGIVCENCGEVFGAHAVYRCPLPGGGEFEIARVPVVDEEDLHETD